MPRPCEAHHVLDALAHQPSWVEGSCKLCWLSVNDKKYRIRMGLEDAPLPPTGVGSQVKRILAELGIYASSGCNCEGKALDWDRQGLEWCETHQEELVETLREKEKSLGWVASLLLRATAIFSKIAWKLDIQDPARGIIQEALKRAKDARLQ